MDTLDRAQRRIWSLKEHLEAVVRRDPEQEVRGMAVPVLDGVIADAREHCGDDPLIGAIVEVISPENIAADEELRAVDVLLVVDQLATTLGRPMPGIA